MQKKWHSAKRLMKGGRLVSYQLQMIGLKQKVDATQKVLDEASAQIKQQRKRANTLLPHTANSQRVFGDAMERTQDECKQRLKWHKDVAQKKQVRTKEQLANVRVVKRQDCGSYEARITDLEAQITAKERQHAQDMKRMAVKVDEARANTAKEQSSLREARGCECTWKAKAHEAEARKVEAEARKVEAEARKVEAKKQVAGLQAKVAT